MRSPRRRRQHQPETVIEGRPDLTVAAANREGVATLLVDVLLTVLDHAVAADEAAARARNGDTVKGEQRGHDSEDGALHEDSAC
jgi:hypothetical protein